MAMMSIGTLSRRTGVHIETIRYYERVGVLPKADRAANGRRTYCEADAGRVVFIRHARELGFDLKAARTLLALQESPEMPCKEADDLASTQLAAVESRLRRLTALRNELRRMAHRCKNERVADCRVIQAVSRLG